ncbi:DNA repair protein XRCC4-like [Phalaenopsis equestris]|uniref:DNA repair protein XRCC4-like n=1 Tax=Phalaenopsis equestris TaxID=78828 RepID=UPI0009E26301|nr:DNA repair protein XRCC4-like [Phalaenopsis equestris]XP_020586125.1 DNA repair protein XRCC4-like [Phalaenopsis equestris]
MEYNPARNADARHTCLKLELPSASGRSNASIFIRGTWFTSHFHLSITDGFDAWTCEGSDAEVRQRAEQWDQSVSEYIALAERYLGFQQPDSKYGFEDAGKGHRRLSWTFEKEGTKLEWRWKCQPSSDSKQNIVEILDFLMDANIRLSEEVIRKTQSFEKLKVEAERCLSQSQTFSNEKAEFESAAYAKFIDVLNSKKAKLRELRDRISKINGKAVEDDESSDKAQRFDGGSDDENAIEMYRDSGSDSADA